VTTPRTNTHTHTHTRTDAPDRLHHPDCDLLREVLGAEHVAQCGLREQASRVMRVLDTVLPRGGSV